MVGLCVQTCVCMLHRLRQIPAGRRSVPVTWLLCTPTWALAHFTAIPIHYLTTFRILLDVLVFLALEYI